MSSEVSKLQAKEKAACRQPDPTDGGDLGYGGIKIQGKDASQTPEQEEVGICKGLAGPCQVQRWSPDIPCTPRVCFDNQAYLL